MRIFVLIVCCFLFQINTVQAQNAEAILDGVIKNYQQVKDYKADLQIVSDIPFIKILPMKATIYFQQPDQIKIVSKGIAILPRQGFDQMYKAITDRKSYTIVPQGNENINDKHASIISILPLSDTMEVILGKFWIDTTRHVILKSQITTKTNGTIIASYDYGAYSNFGLPDKMEFLIDVKKFKIPKAVAADLNNYNKEQENGKPVRKGRIEIRLSNYVINKGVKGK